MLQYRKNYLHMGFPVSAPPATRRPQVLVTDYLKNVHPFVTRNVKKENVLLRTNVNVIFLSLDPYAISLVNVMDTPTALVLILLV